MVFGGALLEESTEYAVGGRYSPRAQEGEEAEPGDPAATTDESTTVLLMSDMMISLKDVFASATAALALILGNNVFTGKGRRTETEA